MQSSVDLASLASPFDDFFQKYIPREHEKALRNCFIQALAFIFICGILFGLFYVYSILDPFCVPLFWALLTGTVLHPYKRRMTNSLRQSLESLRKSEKTMAVAVGASLFRNGDGLAVLVAEQLLRFGLLIAGDCFSNGAAFEVELPLGAFTAGFDAAPATCPEVVTGGF